ncbi:platelet-activating factor acetylhydrolase IB subunit [Mitsuaria sp. GD03876]|uniref:platelet-activating factor acetylhydrolase IB subunit n=1 Tax=Mitsuaria sp. GD03876 TaxID=2975399 RepID=UPI00244C8663|nr:platelet-activating factor acetylhydrolase IB subunit [Mitsuaria sp. GD03876]MDH0863337.1 platelet-activating factor acetylhydrolase IB subunit [Mitsuaria sp. GD03876]
MKPTIEKKSSRLPSMLSRVPAFTLALSAAALTAATPAVATTPCQDCRMASVMPEPQDPAKAPWWQPRHEAKLAEVRAMRESGRSPKVVFLGDSITQGWENVGKPVWDEAFAGYDALNLGFAGDKTENVRWRLKQGEIDGIAPRVVVLMIGTNNTGDRHDEPRKTEAGVLNVLQDLRQRLPGAKVLLLAIFPRGFKADDAMRAVNAEVNQQIRVHADGERVHFLDIGASLMNADGTLSPEVMPDGLHLSERGYRQWAQAMQPTLAKLLDASKP